MKRIIAWQRLDTAGLEFAEFEFDPVRIDAEVVLIENGKPCAASYRIECDEAATTLGAFVRLRSDGVQRECSLLRKIRNRHRVPSISEPGAKESICAHGRKVE